MLDKVREKIDIIDDKIAELYNERMKCVKEVAEIKSKNAQAVSQMSREKEIINRVVKKTEPEIRVFTKQIFESLFETSKAYQNRLIHIDSPVQRKIAAALNEIKEFPVEATVACQGIEGAYSNIAAEKLFPLSEITYFKTFEAVFNAVEKGLCRYGILPIENSSVGSVNAVYDLMKGHKFFVVRSVKLRIEHNLLVPKGTKIGDIKTIYSHEQALGQCGAFLKKLGSKAQIEECENTAVAARTVMLSENKNAACIASRECADIYDLEIIESNIQDADNNYTRFICISKNLEITSDARKISVMTSLPHQPGSLNKALNKFSTLGLNLTKLESRPLPNTDFNFMFYFDFDADLKNQEIQNLIAELENSAEQFNFLGWYFEVV